MIFCFFLLLLIKMNLEQEILSVLVQAGSKGLKLEKNARHVYNSGNSIFHPLDYKMVYNFVSQYLMKNSKDPRSLIEKGKEYGVYCINYHSSAVRQLMLDFSSATALPEAGAEEQKDKKAQEIDLFGDF